MATESPEISPFDGSSPRDWDALRLQSLAPGGFGNARAYIWPRLLHLNRDVNQSPQNYQEEHEPHQDERQIRLDTDRSFVLYPVDDSPEDVRLARQAELNKLIVKVFRRRPGLNYFQGFHDIATVLQLTLPPEVALHALEKLSLHRLRDSMGHTLEPLTGLMIILQRLLRLADPPYAAVLEELSFLPYAALPHLLTLFAHATPTLPLIQHIFDYIFARPPLIIVYLVAAVTLSRKDEVLRFGGIGDEGMIHSVLTGLPTFTDYSDVHGDAQTLPDPEPAAAVPEHFGVTDRADDLPLAHEVSKGACKTSEPDVYTGIPLPSPTPVPLPSPPGAIAAVRSEAGTPPIPDSPPPHNEGMPAVGDHQAPPLSQPGTSISISTPQSAPSGLASSDPADIPLPPSPVSTSPASPIHAESSHSQSIYSLLRVLRLSDELLDRFPPSTPDLCLTRTLGPASAMRTWAQESALLPNDDQAEALVVAGTDIVVREVLEPPPHEKEPRQKPRKGRMRKSRRSETRLLVVGAVLVLGVAVAVGVRSRRGGGEMADWRALFDTLGAVGDRMLGIFGDS